MLCCVHTIGNNSALLVVLGNSALGAVVGKDGRKDKEKRDDGTDAHFQARDDENSTTRELFYISHYSYILLR